MTRPAVPASLTEQGRQQTTTMSLLGTTTGTSKTATPADGRSYQRQPLPAEISRVLDWVHTRPADDGTDWETVCLECGQRLHLMDGYGLEPDGTSLAQQANAALDHAPTCPNRLGEPLGNLRQRGDDLTTDHTATDQTIAITGSKDCSHGH